MGRQCPTKGVLNIRGEHFPCDAMDGIHPDCDTHEGWPHSSKAAEAIWTDDPFPTVLPEPELELGRATPWERLFLTVAVLLVAAFFAGVFAYYFRGQSYKHDEKVQQVCVDHGGVWRGDTCRWQP